MNGCYSLGKSVGEYTNVPPYGYYGDVFFFSFVWGGLRELFMTLHRLWVLWFFVTPRPQTMTGWNLKFHPVEGQVFLRNLYAFFVKIWSFFCGCNHLNLKNVNFFFLLGWKERTSKFTQMCSYILLFKKLSSFFVYPENHAPTGSIGLEYFSCMDTAYVRETPPPKQPNQRYFVPPFWIPWNF